MNGDHANGIGQPAANAAGQADPQIIQALEIAHSARSSNEHRQEAYQYLENVKTHNEAPYHGFLLASNASYPPIIRHFGLSLLESAVRYKWQDYSTEQTQTVRNWIFQLTQAISVEDPSFIRNKIAQLWVEVAKRSWMLDWMNMDELLYNLWNGGPIEKFFVLEVLENLSENSFGREDSITALRGDELSNACIDIFTPAEVFRKHFPRRDDTGVRYGEDGWLLRVADFLSWCLSQDPKDATVAACAVKAASMLKSALDWVLLRAVGATEIPSRLCQALASSNKALILECLQCFFILFSRRPRFQEEDVTDLVLPMFEAENVEVFRKVYEWSSINPTDIDDERYLICKKLTPMMFQLGLFVEEKPGDFFGHVDMNFFFELMLQTLQNPSLHVSIPVLHLWALYMGSPLIRQSSVVLNRVASLLQICSERLLRYDDLPPETEHPALLFLAEDIETIPERHQFLGNYSRFARDVIDGIVQQRPAEAMSHILNQTDDLMAHLYDNEPSFDKSQCVKFGSVPAIRLDAQASVIEAAVMGYAKWRSEQRAIQGEHLDREQGEIDGHLEQWAMKLLPKSYEDPSVQQRLIILFVSLAVGPLRKSSGLVNSVFQYVIQTKAAFVQPHKLPTDASMYDLQVQELQRFCSHQLQRLAMKSYEFLIDHYDSVESQLQRYSGQLDASDDDRERSLSVPYIILQRTSKISDEERFARLRTFIQPCLAAWTDPKLESSLQHLEGFCKLIGLTSFQEEFMSQNAHNIPNWSDIPLKESGRKLKEHVEEAKQQLPVRLTRMFLGASVDRAEPPALEVAKALWGEHVPIMLPHIISMIKLAIDFSEPSTWNGAPPAGQLIVRRIMRDRFWQVGISSGTRDEFYNKVTSTKGTLEGLASAIRGCVRDVRETCFKLLSLLTFLGDAFYRFEELPNPLCEAMFSHPMALSLHQTVILLETARAIVEQCPQSRHTAFLTPMLPSLYNHLDEKISKQWEIIDQRSKGANEDDDLTEEMKEESILRNLTFNAVLFVMRIFDPNPARSVAAKLPPRDSKDALGPMRLDIFVMSNPQVFKSVIMFCTHALRMHDSRSCSYIVRVLRSIIPTFAVTQSDPNNPNCPPLSPDVFAEIREFMSDEVFKACITSLHDPYFVDIQSDLAGLIARIITNYASLTPTPTNILLSLPDMAEDKVHTAVRQLIEYRDSKKQKSIVLKLLAGLRGISIAEQGKILQRELKRRQDPTLSKYTQGEVAVKEVKPEEEEALEGVANMFEGA